MLDSQNVGIIVMISVLQIIKPRAREGSALRIGPQPCAASLDNSSRAALEGAAEEEKADVVIC